MSTATTEGRALRDPELLGQTVVVIGGSAGIGLETARRARAEGASVVLTARDLAAAENQAAELGGRLIAIPLAPRLRGPSLQKVRRPARALASQPYVPSLREVPTGLVRAAFGAGRQH